MSAWVLLRGWARESRHWGSFPETLRSHLPEAEVIALDLPGNGALHSRASPTRVEDMVSCYRAALRERGVAPPYHLLGLSLGAMACIEWARTAPDEVAAAVLVNTSVRPFSRAYERLRPRNYALLLWLALLERNAAARERSILRLTSAAKPFDAETLRAWVRFAHEYPVSRANALRQLLAAARYRAPIAAPGVPLVILCARRDALVDPECSRKLARHWNAPCMEHPDAGHDLPLDDGAWVALQVKRCLRPS